MKKGIRVLFLSVALMASLSGVAANNYDVIVVDDGATKVGKAVSILDAKEFRLELLQPVSIVYFEAPAEMLPCVVAVNSVPVRASKVKQVLSAANRVNGFGNSLFPYQKSQKKLYLTNCAIRQCMRDAAFAVS